MIWTWRQGKGRGLLRTGVGRVLLYYCIYCICIYKMYTVVEGGGQVVGMGFRSTFINRVLQF